MSVKDTPIYLNKKSRHRNVENNFFQGDNMTNIFQGDKYEKILQFSIDNEYKFLPQSKSFGKLIF